MQVPLVTERMKGVFLGFFWFLFLFFIVLDGRCRPLKPAIQKYAHMFHFKKYEL